MGEIADMMLDGTMDFETGEWNFDGQDGPGFPMTGAEAAEWKRTTRPARRRQRALREAYDGPTAYQVTKKTRAKVEAFGTLRANDFYHWQIRDGGRVVADWWPHKSKFRVAGKLYRGNEGDFLRILIRAAT